MGTHVRVYLDATDRARKDDAEKAQFMEFEREARDGILDRLARRSDLVATKQAAIASSHLLPAPPQAKVEAIAKEILPYRPEPVKSISNDIEHGALKRRGSSDAVVGSRAAAEKNPPTPVPAAATSASTAAAAPQRGFGSAAIADVISPDRFKAVPLNAAGRAVEGMSMGMGIGMGQAGQAARAGGRERQGGGGGAELPPPPPPPPSLPPPPPPPAQTAAEVPDLLAAAAPPPSSPPPHPPAPPAAAAPLAPPSSTTTWRQAPEVSAVAASPPLASIPKGGSARAEAPIPLGPSPPLAHAHMRGAYGHAMGAGNQEEGQLEFDPQQAVQDNLDNFHEAGRTGDYSYLAVLPSSRPLLRRAHGQYSPSPSGPGGGGPWGGGAGVTRSGGREKPPRPGLASPSSTIGGAAYVSVSPPGGTTSYTSYRSPPRSSPGGLGGGAEHEDWAGPAGMPVSMSEATPGRPLSPARLKARELASRLAAQEATARRVWASQDIWAAPEPGPGLGRHAHVHRPGGRVGGGGGGGRSESPEAGLYGRVVGGRVVERAGAGGGRGSGGREEVEAYTADDEGQEEDGEEGDYYTDEDEDDEEEHGAGLDWSRLASATAQEVESSLSSMTAVQLNLFLRTLDPSALHAAHAALARAAVAYRQQEGGGGGWAGRVRGQPSRAGLLPLPPPPSSVGTTLSPTPAPAPAPSLPLAYTPVYLQGAGGDSSEESEAEEQEQGRGQGREGRAGRGAHGPAPPVEEDGVGGGAGGEGDSEGELMSQQQLALFKRTLQAHTGAEALVRAQQATAALEARQASLLARTGRAGGGGGIDLGLGVGWDDSGHLSATAALFSSSSSGGTPSRPRPGSLSTLAYDEYCRGLGPAALQHQQQGQRGAAAESKKEQEEGEEAAGVIIVPGAAPGNYVVDGRRPPPGSGKGKGTGGRPGNAPLAPSSLSLSLSSSAASRVSQDVDDRLAARGGGGGGGGGRGVGVTGLTLPGPGPGPGRSPLRAPAAAPRPGGKGEKGGSKGSSAAPAPAPSVLDAGGGGGEDEGDLDISALLAKGHNHAHGAALDAALARLLEDRLKGSGQQGGGIIDMEGDDL